MKFSPLALLLAITLTPTHPFLHNPHYSSSAPFLTSTSLQSSNNAITKLPNSSISITLTAPPPATTAAFEKACRDLSKTLTIPGFRKGTPIPPAVLESAMAAKGGRTKLREEAIKALVGELLEPVLQEEGVQPIGQPQLVQGVEVLAEGFVPGEVLEVEVKCDVWPELKWKEDMGYKGLKGGYTRPPFNQAKMDKAVEDLRERYAVMSPIEDPAHELAMGNACSVNMVGYLSTAEGTKGDPLPSDTASGDNVEVILGQGRYMEGLVEGLIGAKLGDTVTVNVSFPQALRDKNLAGKGAIFDVTVLSAAERTLPTVDDAFAAQVKPDLTKESLEQQLKEAIDAEDSKEYIGARNQALSDALAEVIDVEVPDTILTQQAKDSYANMMAEMRQGGTSDAEIKKLITPENFEKYKDIVAPGIIKDFKVSMAADYIAEQERIEVPTNELEEQMANLKKEAASGGEEFDEAVFRPRVESTMQRRLVFDFLAEHADLEITYSDAAGKEGEFDPKLMEQLADDTLKREQEIEAAGEGEDSTTGKVESYSSELVVEEASQEEEEVVMAEAPQEEEEQVQEIDESKYENMTEEERNFAILVDLGIVSPTPDPDDDDYDSSKDDEFCPDYDDA